MSDFALAAEGLRRSRQPGYRGTVVAYQSGGVIVISFRDDDGFDARVSHDEYLRLQESHGAPKVDSVSGDGPTRNLTPGNTLDNF